MADAPTLEQIAQELYVADPDSFVGRRTELVKKYRADGEKELAKQIGGLRKPTKSANLLNILAHDRPELIASLLELGDQLHQAQRALDGPRLRELNGDRRMLLNSILSAVGGIVERAPTSGILDEVNATLIAALADQQVATHLRAGLLVQPGDWAGFGFDIGPNLTVLPGGKSAAPAKASGKKEPHHKESVPTLGKPAPPAEPTAEPTVEPAAEPAAEPEPVTGPATKPRTKAPAKPPAKSGPTAAELRAARRAELDDEREARMQARDSGVADRKAHQLADAEKDLASAETRLAAAQVAVDDAQTRVDELVEQLDTAREALQQAESDQQLAQRVRREAFQIVARVKRRGG